MPCRSAPAENCRRRNSENSQFLPLSFTVDSVRAQATTLALLPIFIGTNSISTNAHGMFIQLLVIHRPGIAITMFL